MPKQTPLQLLRNRVQELKWSGMTQYQIAAKLEISPNFLSMVLRGRRPVTASMLEYIGLEKVETVTYKRKRK